MRVTKKDVIWNYIGTFMSLGSNFLLLPFMLYFLSGEALGLWYVFLSIGAIVILFDFGFNPTLARNVAYSWSGAKELSKVGALFINESEPNIYLLKKVIFTSKKIYFYISIIALVILVTVGTMYILHISSHMNGFSHFIAWGIFCIAVFLNLYYGYYNTFLRGVGAISQYNIANVLSRSLQIIVTIVLLFIGFGLIGVSVGYLAYGLFFRFISKKAFYKYEDIGLRLKKEAAQIEMEEFKETFQLIWYNAWRDGLVSVSKYLSQQSTVIICSMFLTLTETGIYAISVQLVAAVATIAGALYTTYQPALQSAYIKEDTAESKILMSTAMTVYCLFFWISLLALIFIGIPVLTLINPSIIFSIPLLLVIALYEFLLRHHSFYASYISNTNSVPYMKAFLVSSIASVVLATLVIIVFEAGVMGLVMSQISIQLIYNNWKWPYIVMNSLKITPFQMFKIGMNELNKKFMQKNILKGLR